MGADVGLNGQANLAQFASAVCSPRCLARELDSGQEHGHEDCDYRNHNQNFK